MLRTSARVFSASHASVISSRAWYLLLQFRHWRQLQHIKFTQRDSSMRSLHGSSTLLKRDVAADRPHPRTLYSDSAIVAVQGRFKLKSGTGSMLSPLDSRPRLLVDPRVLHRYTAWFSSPIPGTACCGLSPLPKSLHLTGPRVNHNRPMP